MDNYFSVNEIAELFNINRQTLHYYDRIGLFKPEYREPHNSYRKYSYSQIAQLAFIMYLRTIGCSIENIKTILNYGDMNLTMLQLKQQSDMLKERYNEILKIDKVIQRKLTFVQEHITKTDQIQIRKHPRRAYVRIGKENDLYENEIFYYFPTVVFYNYNERDSKYDKIFGACLDPEALKQDYGDRAEYIDENSYLCLYHKGPYESISLTLTRIYQEYKHLSLSRDFICINIVDQFLEKEPQNFITEIQIPVDCIPAI